MYRRNKLAVAEAEISQVAGRSHTMALQARVGYSTARVSSPGLKPGRRVGDPAYRFGCCWVVVEMKVVRWTTFNFCVVGELQET